MGPQSDGPGDPVTGARTGPRILRGLAGAATLAASPAPAQEGPVSGERPGFSGTPVVLGVGRTQIEAGYGYTRRDGGGSVQQLPEALLRHGFAERLELQVGWTGLQRLRFGGASETVVTDASLGLKWAANSPRAPVPIALVASVSLPVGDDRVSSDTVDPSLSAFYGSNRGLPWFGTTVLTVSDGDTTLGQALGLNLPLTGQVTGYVEGYGIYGDGSGTHAVNGGFTWLPDRNLQLDAFLGLGVDDGPDHFLGFGVAWRF